MGFNSAFKGLNNRACLTAADGGILQRVEARQTNGTEGTRMSNLFRPYNSLHL